MKTLTGCCMLFLASVWLASGSESERSRLSPVVAVGDGYLAGFGSGGLVARGRPGQVQSIPALVARQAGVRLSLPLIDGPGLPPQLTIEDANHNGTIDAGEIRRPPTKRLASLRVSPGAQNIAVPGEDTASLFDAVTESGLSRALADGIRPSLRDVLKPLVLGARNAPGPVSQLSRARALDPKLLLVWLGTTDALRLIPLGATPAVPVPVEDFGVRMRRALEQLAETGADMAVANVPDPSRFAVLRRAAGDVTRCRDQDGRDRAVDPDALLSVTLDPKLLPAPPCDRVLTPAERDRVRATVAGYNTEIATAIAEVEREKGVRIALVDVFRLFDEVATSGLDLDADGTPELTGGYHGGFFSLDGTYLSRAGGAAVANEFIASIDDRFGLAIPRVDVRRAAAHERRAAKRFRRGGEPAFGALATHAGPSASLPRALLHRLTRRLEATAQTGPGDDAGDLRLTPAVVGTPTSYLMFSGLETGEVYEFDETLSCPVVAAPVCTGTRACQKTTTALPSELRSRAMAIPEAYGRTYHFVQVTATPSPTEACAPVLGFDTNDVVPTCSADVCVQPNGTMRYRLFDRVNGVTVGTPTATMPASQWRRVEVRVRLRSGINDDECEFRLDGATVAASTTLNLGTGVLDSGFVTNRQGAFPQPPNPGDWLATYDDVALTQGVWPGPGRTIARQGRAGIPTYDQFPPIGAFDVETAWSNTPANPTSRAESPNTGDPLAQTMLVAPFNQGIDGLTSLGQLAVCQTWIHANTFATPDRTYGVRRRVAGVTRDATIPGMGTAYNTYSDGLLGGFWVDTLTNVNAAEIGAVKSGGAGGARLAVNDAWLACEYQPGPGEPACTPLETCAPSWGTVSVATQGGFGNYADGVRCTTGTRPSGYTVQSCSIVLGAVPGGNIRCAVYTDVPADPNRDAICSSAVTAAVPNAVNSLPMVGCPTLAPNTNYWIVWNNTSDAIQYGVGPARCSAAAGVSRYVAATFPTGAWTPDPWGNTIADTCQVVSYLSLVPVSVTTTTSTSSTSTSSTSSTSTTSTTVTSTSSTSLAPTTSTSVPTTTSTTVTSTSSTSTSSTSSTSRTSTSTTSTTSSTLQGLMAAYGFNEANGATVNDASGFANVGTITGATRTTQSRFGSGALVFNGSSDWVTVPDSASLDLTTAMTLEAWVFPTATPTGWRAILSKERPGDLAYFLHAGNGNNRPAGGGVMGNTERILSGPTALTLNAWTHLAVTYNGTTLILYVNGAQAATQAVTGAIVLSNNAFRIGGDAPFGEFFQGRIDEVRVYNRALTAGEITSDMNQGVGP